ncbi:MAG: hypothetical protein J5816_00785 [Clostridia bacterium]|nr:hypothetical protein [Clostridia bacterium]
MNSKEIETVRELAKKVAELAALPIQKERIRLWKKHNGLNPERPMFMIDQVCWGEMNYEDELTLVCEDPVLRGIEWQLRETLYRNKHMADDRPIRNYVTASKSFTVENINLPAITQDGGRGGAQTHVYVDQLPDDEALETKLKMPVVKHDTEATKKTEELYNEILNGILGVKMTGYDGYFHYWDRISWWRGVEAIMYDIADNPDFIHRLLKKTIAMHMCMLDQIEEQGLITTGMDTVHCTGAYNDVMEGYSDDPAENAKANTHTAKNSWTYSAAQLFSMVSPEMHDEFDVQYIIPWFNRFGLGYYGCCEPDDIKVDVLRKLPNLRKISMSPWVNVELGAEKIGKDFVFSRKPNPADLAWDIFPEKNVVKEFETTLAATRKNGCPVEFILKDLTTVKNDPQRLWRWAEIARSYCC